jgi:uncharacterized membrane protein YfcA
MSPIGAIAVLLAAGVVGGAATSAGAIATLISYPVLLAVGIPPVAANVTNAVAVVGTGVTSGLASRPELAGVGRRMRRWAVFSAVGALVGAGLLLTTPDAVFAWVVPVFVAGAALTLLFQPQIAAARRRNGGTSGRDRLPLGVFLIGVYNGYFGAASGIMLLALLMLTAEPQLVRANALKNVLLGVGDVVAAVVFVAFGPVDWPAALALGAGFLVGGALGPRIARRAPPGALRAVIAAAGLVLAAGLFISAAR